MTFIKHAEADSAIRRDRAEHRSAGSFLIRVWYETREATAGPEAFRCYVRNLRTGAERFLSDPETVSHEIVRQIGAVPASDGADDEDEKRALR